MKKKVAVLVGAGSIGQAIIRRVSAGKQVVLADYSLEHAEQAAKTLENAGFECSTILCDLGSKADILKLVEFATGKGDVTNLVNAAVVSARRMGTTATLDTLNKYFLHGEMPVAASRYWNAVHGNSPEEVMKDEEGLQTMRVLGRNMAVPSTMLSTSRCLPSYPCHPC